MSKKVYLLEAELDNIVYYKIGYTSRTGKKRSQDLATANPSNFTVIAEYESKFASLIERQLHRIYNQFRIKGEWFHADSGLSADVFLTKCSKLDDTLKLLAENNTWFKENILKQ